MVDYGYYEGIYLGNKVKDMNTFRRLSKKAERAVAYNTFNRIYKLQEGITLEAVKDTICELVDIYVNEDNLDNVKQEVLENSSFTYRDRDVELVNTVNGVIRVNLEHTGLLNRGWGRYTDI